MTTTAADARYETARAIAAGLPGATARNMPALGFASITWFPECGGVVKIWVRRATIEVEMRDIPDRAITDAVQAIARVQKAQRRAVPA